MMMKFIKIMMGTKLLRKLYLRKLEYEEKIWNY